MTRTPVSALHRAAVGLAVTATLGLALLARTGVTQAQAAGGFAGAPNFGAGTQAAVVFLGGSVDQLEAAARASGAGGGGASIAARSCSSVASPASGVSRKARTTLPVNWLRV